MGFFDIFRKKQDTPPSEEQVRQQRQKDRQQGPRERMQKEPEQQRQKRARTPLA